MKTKRTKKPAPGTLRRRKHAAKQRCELFDLLGSVCAHCGSVKNLTVDHISGFCEWDRNGVHSTKRMRIYLDEAREGKLQLLCKRCNYSKQDSAEEDDDF